MQGQKIVYLNFLRRVTLEVNNCIEKFIYPVLLKNTPELGSKVLFVCEERSNIVSKTNHNFTDLNLSSK